MALDYLSSWFTQKLLSTSDAATGRIKTDPYYDAIARGDIANTRRVALYGTNQDIDTLTEPEDLWPGGGLYPWMSTDTSLEILSDSANDTAAGTGARTVLIDGLNSAWEPITDTVVLNGLTPVALSNQFFRINSAAIITAGTGQVNAGILTIRDSGAGTTRGVMPVGVGNLRQAVYSVAAGFQFYITQIVGVCNRVDTNDRWAVISSIVIRNGILMSPAEIGVTASPYTQDYAIPAALPDMTDTVLRAVRVSGNNSSVTGGIIGYLAKSA